LLKALRLVGIHLIAVLLIYSNIDGILRTGGLYLYIDQHKRQRALPSFYPLSYFFSQFGVFANWPRYNLYFSAYGLKGKPEYLPDRPDSEMINLNLFEKFPFMRGEVTKRLFFEASFDSDYKRRREEYTRLLHILRDRYNRKNPDDQISEVFLFFHSWPKRPGDFFSGFAQGQVILIGVLSGFPGEVAIGLDQHNSFRHIAIGRPGKREISNADQKH